MKPTDPPALATALLELLIPPRTSAGLVGDLVEEYRNGRSRTWYWQQAIVALMRAAIREGQKHKFQASSAIVLGYLCGASLHYFTTSAVGKFVGPVHGGWRVPPVFASCIYQRRHQRMDSQSNPFTTDGARLCNLLRDGQCRGPCGVRVRRSH